MSTPFSIMALWREYRNGLARVSQAARRRLWPLYQVVILPVVLWGLTCSPLFAANALPAPRWQVIRKALSELETGSNPKAIGAKGEITEYQILPAIWAAECRAVRLPASGYRNRELAWRITHRLLNRRVGAFVNATRRSPTPREIYALWNAPGAFAETGYKWDRLSPVVKERCQRFAALCEAPNPATRRAVLGGSNLLASSNRSQAAGKPIGMAPVR
jgi:hypothetical protein